VFPSPLFYISEARCCFKYKTSFMHVIIHRYLRFCNKSIIIVIMYPVFVHELSCIFIYIYIYMYSMCRNAEKKPFLKLFFHAVQYHISPSGGGVTPKCCAWPL